MPLSLTLGQVGGSYVLDHACFTSTAYIYDRATVESIVGPQGLQPLQLMSMRFPRRYFVDKMLYALRCCPQGWRAYDTKTASGDTVDFGFYAKCWYNLLDLKPQGGTRLIVEHSPDWGASWDAWLAVFLLEYAKFCGDGDGFCRDRAALILKGFTALDWNVDASSCVGAENRHRCACLPPTAR